MPSNSMATSFIVGLCFPLEFKHRIAKLAISKTTPFESSCTTTGSNIDITRPSSIANIKCVAKFLCSPNLVKEIGFSLVKSSSKTTPKLYTSLFSVN
ncbi:hypothetical protein HanPI659440_Chr14g0557811 [Helianthus annuus]|nr:hypothetical protein HanPI659440_Chr14g0557811 [Helianthus annuus]